MNKQSLWLAAIASLLLAKPSFAGYGTGTVGQVLVGLNGDHVYVQLLSPTMTSWACTAHHSLGFQFQFALSQGGGRDMLATVLTAAATGKAILMQGGGTCAWDNTLEDIVYVILQP
jgi:hypothetical protein